MVGEKEGQRGMPSFGRPFTETTVRYFDRADAAAARKWLEESEWDSVLRAGNPQLEMVQPK